MTFVYHKDQFRVCKKCKNSFPNTQEYFYHAKQKTKNKIYTPTLRSTCKSCYKGPKKEKITVTHKTCKTCKNEFLANEEYFRLKTDKRGCKYFYYNCKKCESKYNNQRSIAKHAKNISKLLEISVEDYKTKNYMGWVAYKRKFPSSTYEQYLNYKNSSRQRTDIKRKEQRDILTNNYVKQLITKRSNIKVKDLEEYPDLIEAYKVNLLLKRKVYEKCN